MASTRRLRKIIAKYEDADLQAQHDCCGCSEPWNLYDALLKELKALTQTPPRVDTRLTRST